MPPSEPSPPRAGGIRGPMADLYDVFVDWPGRLGRELPGLERRLAAAGARRVLDVGCGTGRHVQALLQRGYDAHGADLSDDMLAQAHELLGGRERLHAWRLGDEPPGSLRAAAPFDAVISMGNVWPQLALDAEARAAARAFVELLRPGGLLLLGLKAVGVRLASRDPYMPLMRRQHEGRPLWFLRFVDLEVGPGPAGERLADFHMAVVGGDAESLEREALLHSVTRVRAWTPDELAAWLAQVGFEDVRVSGSLADPGVEPSGEDVFASARVAAG